MRDAGGHTHTHGGEAHCAEQQLTRERGDDFQVGVDRQHHGAAQDPGLRRQHLRALIQADQNRFRARQPELHTNMERVLRRSQVKQMMSI